MKLDKEELKTTIKDLENDVLKLEKIIQERKENEKFERQQTKANINLLNKEKLKIEKKYNELMETSDI